MKEKCHHCEQEAVWMRHSHEAEATYTCEEHLERVSHEVYQYSAEGFSREEHNPQRINDYNTII